MLAPLRRLRARRGPHAGRGAAVTGCCLAACFAGLGARLARAQAVPVDTVPNRNAPAPTRAAQQWEERLERAGLGWAARVLRDTVRAEAPPADTVPLGGRAPVRCEGQTISDIVVVTQPPYPPGGVLGRLEFVERSVRALHATTRPEVVRRFLVLSPGDACTELRRSESERILRAQPYLVDARVVPYDDGKGGVLLEVQTRDEFSGIIALAARTAAPPINALRIGEANLAGGGVYAAMDWRDNGLGYRDGLGARIRHYQFLGRPYQLTLDARRRRVGDEWFVDASYPFLTDLQKIAWRAAAGGSNDFIRVRRPEEDGNVLFFRRGYADVGGVLRIGQPGRLSVFGVSGSMERAMTHDHVQQLTDSGMVDDFGTPLDFMPSERYPEQRSVRLNALWGVRNVRFLPVAGFDALTGTQDVRRGIQFGVQAGRGLRAFGSRVNDVFLAGDAYVGLGSVRSFLRFQANVEGRKIDGDGRWSGVVAGGRLNWTRVESERRRTVVNFEYGGGWRPRVPMQLALGDREGGVRGFGGADAAGARRLIGRIEERWMLGRPFGLGDAGIAGFVDAGRLWAGDAPYGVTTGMRAAVGVGLLAAVPPGSRRLWRVDLAMPVTKEPGARLELRFSNRDLTRLFWREPMDVQLGRERASPSGVFDWPQ